MTTPTERTLAILQAREFLAYLAAQQSYTPEAINNLRTQAAQLLEHYPDEQVMRSANWNCPTLFGKLPKLPGSTGEASKNKTLSGWVRWLLFEDSERGQNVIVGVGLVGCILGVVAAIWFN